MEKNFNELVEILRQIASVKIINASMEPCKIQFQSDADMANKIGKIAKDLNKECSCQFFSTLGIDNQLICEIIFNGKIKNIAIELFLKNLYQIENLNNSILGIPDLSLVTIRQISAELKKRDNLTFAIVWIENNSKDNIAIEGSGNPTQVVGLLARGTHMAINWADKNIKFFDPNDG